MSFLETILRERRRLQAEMAAPVIRVELGQRQMAELRAMAAAPSDPENMPRIYGVPLWAMPIADHVRIVREGED